MTSKNDFLMGDGSDDTAAAPGPWFMASYPGKCSGCFAPFSEGDLIRADGEGGWEAQYCREDH